MAVDLSPRLCRVTITNPDGSDPFDVTDLLIALETKDQPLDFSGWVMTSGTLELSVEVPGFNTKKLDPYETPEQWSRGMRVFVEVRRSNGNYVTHPRGELYILRRPAPPTEVAGVEGRVLRIDVGCEASLRDYRQPAEDVSEIKLGQNTDPSTIINRLAKRAAFSGSLADPITNHPLNYPVFDLDGNFVSLMGALAWANGRLLYMLNDGQIKSQIIDLEPDTAEFKYIVGRDEQIFDPLPGSERPVEKVKVTSTTQKLDDSDPECEYTYGYGPRSYSQTCYHAWKTNKPRTEQLEKIELGVLFPDWYPGITRLQTKIESKSVDFYEPFGDEKLIRKVETVWEPVGVLFPDLIEEEIEGFPKVIVRNSRWSLTTLVVSSETTTLYKYKDDVVEEIETTVKRPKGILYPTFAAQRGSVTESVIVVVTGGIETVRDLLRQQFTRQSWRKKCGRWFQKTETRQYGENAKSTAPSAGSSGTSTQPPATERKNNDWAEETKNLEAEVKFKAGPGSEFDERVREFQVKPGTATSDEQLEEIGLRIGKILQGRDFGWSFGVELSDKWLDRSYTPLVVMDWRKGGSRKRYLANGLVFVTTKEEALVGGELIEAGRTKILAARGNEYGIPIGEEITFNFDPVTGLNEVGLTETQVEAIYDGYSDGTLPATYDAATIPSFVSSIPGSISILVGFSGGIEPGDITTPVAVVDEIATVQIAITSGSPAPEVVVDSNGSVVTFNGEIVTSL